MKDENNTRHDYYGKAPTKLCTQLQFKFSAVLIDELG